MAIAYREEPDIYHSEYFTKLSSINSDLDVTVLFDTGAFFSIIYLQDLLFGTKISLNDFDSFFLVL